MSTSGEHRPRIRILAATAALATTAFSRPQLAQAQPQAPVQPRGFASLRQIGAGVPNVGYVDEGPARGPVVILLHGWPYDIHSYIGVVPLLTQAGYRVIVPHLRGYGSTRFRDSHAVRNGEQAALAADVVAPMDALKIDKAILAGYDWGARMADIVAALWPQRVKGLVSVSGYLIGSQEAGKQPLPPAAEQQRWYPFYFATERGKAGYEKNTHDFAKLIWKTASPQWRFDDATFERSAAALQNPDHAAVTIHNYRWRLGLAGEAKYAALEARPAESPAITVPTVTMEGDANGAPHPERAAYAKRFSGRYRHELISGGIGRNLPQEAPHLECLPPRCLAGVLSCRCARATARSAWSASEGNYDRTERIIQSLLAEVGKPVRFQVRIDGQAPGQGRAFAFTFG